MRKPQCNLDRKKALQQQGWLFMMIELSLIFYSAQCYFLVRTIFIVDLYLPQVILQM